MLPRQQLIMFDLDGTLAQSKQPISPAMGEALKGLLERKQVAVISGGTWEQYRKQLLEYLPSLSDLSRLFLLPTSGTKLYTFAETWKEVYAETIDTKERARIITLLQEAVEQKLPHIETLYGEQIEDRGSQITFSALGQNAPLSVKERWDLDQAKRSLVVSALAPLLPDYEIRMGGSTSIDITKKGMDKAHGIKKLSQYLSIPLDDILYMGDALYEGGNDYAARQLGLSCVQVSNEKEALQYVQSWIQKAQ